jgi:hypothetical protein
MLGPILPNAPVLQFLCQGHLGKLPFFSSSYPSSIALHHLMWSLSSNWTFLDFVPELSFLQALLVEAYISICLVSKGTLLECLLYFGPGPWFQGRPWMVASGELTYFWSGWVALQVLKTQVFFSGAGDWKFELLTSWIGMKIVLSPKMSYIFVPASVKVVVIKLFRNPVGKVEGSEFRGCRIWKQNTSLMSTTGANGCYFQFCDDPIGSNYQYA